MEERCLKCHNDPKLYESDLYRKTDWKAGDVRGVLEVVCPLEDNTQETRKTLFDTYLRVAAAAATVLTLSWVALRIGREMAHLRAATPAGRHGAAPPGGRLLVTFFDEATR